MPRIYLAACSHVKRPVMSSDTKPHLLLDSFIYLRGNGDGTRKFIDWLLTADDFLLDSGAFSFMKNSKNTSDIDESNIWEYVHEYIDFINRYDIKKFFEVDLDCLFEYSKVLEFRREIEGKTGKQCIPVWHKSRGLDEWHKMCLEYKYVAIGGIASREIKKSEYYILNDLCNTAHNMGVQVHGLGYLPIGPLNDGSIPFDTVDGTSWQGHMRSKKYRVENNKIVKEDDLELKSGHRSWKENVDECYRAWTQYSFISDGG